MIYLVVARVMDKNSVKGYNILAENGSTTFVTKKSIVKFCKDHSVLNVQISGDNITGKGINLNNIPKIINDKMFGQQQVSGMNTSDVIRLAQPYINQYNQKKKEELQRKEQTNIKDKQNQYIRNKIYLLKNMINIALSMKDITNEMASNGEFTRYIKQIDIDNAEGDSLSNLIKRQGVNGLSNGILDRVHKLENRIRKFDLDRSVLNELNIIKNQCEQLRKLHSETKEIIRQNKYKVNLDKKEDKQLDKKEDLSDAIIINDNDVIEINNDINSMAITDNGLDDIPVISDIEENEAVLAIENETKNIEKLNISNVLNELFLSHDGYSTQNHSPKNGITAEYRSWDNFGMSVVNIITIIYKGTDNKFMIKADIPPMYKIKGYNTDNFKFPGDYTVKITRENIDLAKAGLQDYINNTLQVYAEADKILYEQCNISKQLNKELKEACKNLEQEYAFYSLQDVTSLMQDVTVDKVDNFTDYIRHGLVAKTKSAIATWNELNINNNIVHSNIIEDNLKLLLNKAKKVEEQEIKKQQEEYRRQQQEERQQIQKNKVTHSYGDDEFKKQILNIIDKADDVLYDIDNISESLSDMYSSYREYSSGGYISPFVKRAETILSSIVTKFSRELQLNKECEFHTRRELRTGAWFAGAESDELNEEAAKCESCVEDIVSQLIECINNTSNLSRKTVEEVQSLYNDLFSINIDDSDNYEFNTDSEFIPVYLDFLGVRYDSNDYDGLKGKIKEIIDSIEECIERCKETLTQDNNSENTIDISHISSKDLDEALNLFDDI